MLIDSKGAHAGFLPAPNSLDFSDPTDNLTSSTKLFRDHVIHLAHDSVAWVSDDRCDAIRGCRRST